MPDCINLKEQFGRRFRVEHEESYVAEHGENAFRDDPWLQIIPCRYGHIFPHGDDTLAVSVDGHPNVAGKIRRLACCRIHQDGDFGELTALFNLADFDRVARIMHPRRRRQVSDEERDRLRAMGFQKGRDGHVDAQPTARTCVSRSPADSEHLPTRRPLFDALETP